MAVEPYKNACVPKVSIKSVTSTAAVQLCTGNLLAYQITFEANSANTGVIYLGGVNSAGTALVNATAAIHLSAGDSYTAGPVDKDVNLDLAGWSARASSGTQKMSITRLARRG